MQIRQKFLALAALVVVASASQAAQIRTQNFLVTAPDEQIARQFGQMAEHYRKQKAIEWLGAEIPPWSAPCPLTVKPSMNGAGGATSFNYDRGTYQIISMEINGSLERMLNSVLPHEVTHTIFAHHFRAPVPRWADEGGSVLSEDDQERAKHDQLCRQFLNTPGGKYPLRRLFNLREYHEVSNVMVLYAEGYSVTNYLVGLSDRQTYLNFVATGMRNGWDKAVQTYFQLQSVEELEEAWLQHLRATRDIARNPTRGNSATLAANTQGGNPMGTSMSREVVRLTAPPAQPQLDGPGPIFRGQSNDDRGNSRQHYVSPPPPPGVVPLTGPRPFSANRQVPPPPITLGLPEFAPTAQAQPLQPHGPSPVGYQN